MDDIRLHFALSENDYARFVGSLTADYHRKRPVIFFISSLLATVIALSLLDFAKELVAYKQIPESLQDFLLPILLFFLPYSLIVRFLRQFISMDAIHPQGNFLRARDVRIDKDGMYESSDVYNGFMKWIGVLGIEETEHHILIHTDLLAAYIIPKNAFATQAEVRTFVEQVRAFWEAAKAEVQDKQEKNIYIR